MQQPCNPRIITYNRLGSQDYEQPDRQGHEREAVSCHPRGYSAPARQAHELTRLPQSIVKIITTPLHRNLGIRSSLPSGDFEAQVRRGFRNTVRVAVDNLNKWTTHGDPNSGQ
jgi:hypothetical protein